MKPQTWKVLCKFGLVLIFLYITISKPLWEFLAVVHCSKRALRVLNDTIFDVRSHTNAFAFYLKEKRNVPPTISQKCSLKCWAGHRRGRCVSKLLKAPQRGKCKTCLLHVTKSKYKSKYKTDFIGWGGYRIYRVANMNSWSRHWPPEKPGCLELHSPFCF